MVGEELVVKFTAKIDDFKRSIDAIKAELKKTSGAFDGLKNDIKRANESTDKSIKKIGKTLESELKKYDRASESTRKYARSISELNNRYTSAIAKMQSMTGKFNEQQSSVR